MDLEGYVGVHNPPIIDTVVTQLQQDGTIDGISFQVTGRVQRLDMDKLRTALEFLQTFNLPIHISEFSVIIEGENTPENLKDQARVGADVIRILKEYHVVEVIAFGLEDRLTNNIYKMDNANAGLWLKTDSGEYVPKPIVYTMMAVFIEP
jgi:GH35 family endo-1,4-beta-xylanase